MLLTPTPSRRPSKAQLAALPLSLGAHALVVGLMALSAVLWPSPPPKPKPPRASPVSFRRLDARTWAANRGPVAFKPAPERPAELHPKGQVVDVAPGNNQRAPDAKYLAETNNRVKQETRAKEQTNRYSRATPTTSKNPEALPPSRGESQPVPAPQSGVSLAESVLGKQQASLLAPSVAVASSGAPEASPSEPPGSAEGGGAPNDDLTDVAQGDGTFLNTREWRYAAFFNRVKQAVSAKWDPNARLRSRRNGMGANRTTTVVVTLRPDGSLADVFVTQPSGIDELDAEAMNAFTKAQPFPNPPEALVEQGYIRFGFSFNVTNEGLASSPFRFR